MGKFCNSTNIPAPQTQFKFVARVKMYRVVASQISAYSKASQGKAQDLKISIQGKRLARVTEARKLLLPEF